MLSFNAQERLWRLCRSNLLWRYLLCAGKRPNLTEIMAANAEGLDSLISRAIEKQMIDCPRIPNADLQRLLNN